MVKGNISHEFTLKNIDGTRNYFLGEIKLKELMSKKHKNVCTILNYMENFVVLASTITGCIRISTFTSLLAIPVGNRSPAVGLKICAIAARIKTFKSIPKKRKKKHDKIALLGKSKFNNIELLIYKALIYSLISHYEFVLINNVLKEYNEI